MVDTRRTSKLATWLLVGGLVGCHTSSDRDSKQLESTSAPKQLHHVDLPAVPRGSAAIPKTKGNPNLVDQEARGVHIESLEQARTRVLASLVARKYKRDCVVLDAPAGSDGTKPPFALDAREKHGGVCGGDPATAPRIGTFTVASDGSMTAEGSVAMESIAAEKPVPWPLRP